MSYPKVQEFRSRIQSRVSQVQSRVGVTRPSGMIGGGQIVSKARQRADMVARRLTERRPGIIPMVSEFQPGQRIKGFFGEREITDLAIHKDASAIGQPAYPSTVPGDGTGMSVFVE